tara:strand:+ start:2452 stop:2643 length:192 start_codon:yes stop_codon:yes gene_type:complete
METVLKGKEWNLYLEKNKIENKSYMQLYCCTHNYCQIFKIGEYYFSFKIKKGYKNLASLKKLV